MTNLEIDRILIECSSQTLCGIKPASLFTIPLNKFSKKNFLQWKSIAEKQGLLIKMLKISDVLITVFIYDFAWERKILGDIFVQSYLIGKRYSDVTDAAKTLAELFYRFRNQSGFPHEVGIFLGYPLEDVIGFEENCGKNCKFCGYWKSYCNPAQAKKCFENYRNCRLMCKKWFDEGYSIPQIIKKYNKMAKKAA